MGNQRTNILFIVIGSLAAVLLQVIVAPNIAIRGVVPNCVLVFSVVIAIYNNRTLSCSLGFVLGIVFDLLSSGPIGVMPLVLCVLAYSVSSLNKDMFSGGWVVEVLLLLVASLLGELLYGALLNIVGYDIHFANSLINRILPSAVFDAAFGLVVFPLLNRFSQQQRKEIPTLKGKLR
ncbi:MAG: rod shape-determining protein MreD [Coriobacteriales bacterium]|jgi:rod shape-determining protein MreD|nr:rod shape-determining protein MreD [Coriobacteriales bacterium]